LLVNYTIVLEVVAQIVRSAASGDARVQRVDIACVQEKIVVKVASNDRVLKQGVAHSS